jgi:hypothetical protein
MMSPLSDGGSVFECPWRHPASLAVRRRGIDLLPDLSTQEVTGERDGGDQRYERIAG